MTCGFLPAPIICQAPPACPLPPCLNPPPPPLPAALRQPDNAALNHLETLTCLMPAGLLMALKA